MRFQFILCLIISFILGMVPFVTAQFVDTDGDGIADELDCPPFHSPDTVYYSNYFKDFGCSSEQTGQTYGSLFNSDPSAIRISDATHPDSGVYVKVLGQSSNPDMRIYACGFMGSPGAEIYDFQDPKDFYITCGSVIIQVVSGIVKMNLYAEDGANAHVTLNEDNGLTFEPESGVILTPETNTEEVLVLIQGEEVTIPPGEAIYFEEGETGAGILIDIKPGSEDNCINNDGQGVIPVAILGSASIDVTWIDPATVQLEGLAVKAVGKSNKLLSHIEDINLDGFLDMVVQIEDTDDTFQEGATIATLTAHFYAEFGGDLLKGIDHIRIVPPSLEKEAQSSVADAVPDGYKLHPCSPNPFNPETTIRFDLPVESYVSLEIYNLLGERVVSLAKRSYPAGSHALKWDARNNSSGIYLVTLRAGGFAATGTILFLK